MEPLISVIVPVYNVSKYLDRCVESIVNQTYKNLEIILVDDGSPDNCPAICDEWAQKDSRIQVIHKENGGVSSARNAGLDAANGVYIAFVDSDDYISSEMYQILVKLVVAENADVGSCNIALREENGEIRPSVHFGDKTVEGGDNIVKDYLTYGLCDPGVPNKLYSSRIIPASLRFDENRKIGEDYLFNYYVFKLAEKVCTISTELYYYCFERDDSAVHSNSEEMFLRWQNTKQILGDLKGSGDLYSACLKRYANELLCCCRELLRSNDTELKKSLYPLFVEEIRENGDSFASLELSSKNKLSLGLLRSFPGLFKISYSFFKNFR
ncbi:MAG: glycosyltransferase [Eubacterium sp.]|nr:glycosyltransferase [Eubacterium sp.]